MEKQVEDETQKFLEQDFVKPVTSSTKWVSSLVCVPKKNGDVCLCVDMLKANTAPVIRNYYPIPTLDENLHEVNGVKIFSKSDLAQGYYQIVLVEKSRDITTFSTPQHCVKSRDITTFSTPQHCVKSRDITTFSTPQHCVKTVRIRSYSSPNYHF